MNRLPEILAPAGDTPSFLAALAAGADAVYVGLKHFSARAGADNFSTSDLSRMVDRASQDGKKVYIAFNSLVKPGDLPAAGRLMVRMARDAKPHALILQDPGLLALARQAGFEGELHLSTLANVTHPVALEVARNLGASRVILPRELNIDEIRQTAASAPEGLDLELFVHGALCWCVSGRCYWSSYLGGKSGLRGRCVQPCRRVYRQKSQEGRYFSCQDLSLDVLVKTLMDIPRLNCWKIEGRKKGPHYVYHVTTAYRLLRDALASRTGQGPEDAPDWATARKDAEDLLEMALGRPRTHALFLPQKNATVSTPNEPTGSGLLVGKTQIGQGEKGRPQPFFKTRLELLPGDLLRVGHEDETWHDTIPLSRRVPKAGMCQLRLARHKTPRAGTPVYLIDRREAGLVHLLKQEEERLTRCRAVQPREVSFSPSLPSPVGKVRRQPDIVVRSVLPRGRETRPGRSSMMGLWLSPGTVRGVSRTVAPRVFWWLPPVIWPSEEDSWKRLLVEALRNGGVHFVCNAPWQIALFPPTKGELRLIAGPFCNVANAATVATLARMGFVSAFACPELSGEDLIALPRQSCLPLGVVLSGWWPVGISRHQVPHLKTDETFFSPRGEAFWTRSYGRNLWMYPGWPLDLKAHRAELESAGYAVFAHLEENPPAALEIRRTSEFNWNGSLL